MTKRPAFPINYLLALFVLAIPLSLYFAGAQPVAIDYSDFKQQLAQSELMHVPIVVVSGAADVSRAAEALGASDFLTKPFSLAALLRVVRRFCAPDA